ncbi:MAG: exosortase U [Planctomycetota bacterium]
MSTVETVQGNVANESLDSAPSSTWRWFWLGLYLAVVPLLVPYFSGLWVYQRYRYIPFAIGAVVWLAYTRSDHKFYPPRGWVSWAAIVFGLLLIVLGVVVQFPWFAAVALVLISGAMLYTMRGESDDSLFVLVLPLCTLVQLIRLDVLLVRYLQNITTWLSSVLLDGMAMVNGMAVPHAVANNVIKLADRELFVAEACSGIQSVFTLSFLALLMVAWRRRRVWMAPIYVGIACLLAIFANVIRVTTVALAATWFDADLAEGWPHDLLGYIALAVAGGFLLSFDHLIATLLHRVPEESDFNPLVTVWNFFALRPQQTEGATRSTQRELKQLESRDEETTVVRWAQLLGENRGIQVGFLVLAGVISVASISRVLLSRKPTDFVASDAALVFDPPKEILDQSLKVLSVVDHTSNRGYENPRLGANSDIWECEWNDITAQLVLSQPHKGWHELCDCYERLEWRLLDRDIRSPEDFESMELETDDEGARKSTYVVARFKRPPGQFGYLLFAGIGSDGSYLDAPDSLSAFTHRVWNRIDRTGVWAQNEVIMLQMWVTSPEKLKPKELLELETEFASARARFAEKITANAERLMPAQAQNSRGTVDIRPVNLKAQETIAEGVN